MLAFKAIAAVQLQDMSRHCPFSNQTTHGELLQGSMRQGMLQSGMLVLDALSETVVLVSAASSNFASLGKLANRTGVVGSRSFFW